VTDLIDTRSIGIITGSIDRRDDLAELFL
jgi:hypothetical protein